MTELVQESTEYGIVEREPPEVMARNLRVASHLWSGATLFFFAAFLFAYFYLRSLDSSKTWRPKHVDPSFTLGTLMTVAIVAAAGLLQLGLADHRGDRRPAWRTKGALALLALVIAVVLQIVEWSTQGFGPTDGPYASVYLGWTGLLTIFTFGLAYWVETTLAISVRYRGRAHEPLPEGHGSGDADRSEPDIDDPISLVRPELEAVSGFALTVAGVAVVTWVILYVI
jgi:heme/copper-type cytochrome/quinol oxidase subunit 3